MQNGLVLVNPSAGNGVIRKSLALLKEAVKGHAGWACEVLDNKVWEVSNKEAQLEAILRVAFSHKTSTIVIVGGDGTNHRLFTVMHRIGGDDFLRSVQYAFTNGGTMNFVARAFSAQETPLVNLVRIFTGKAFTRQLQLIRFDGIADYPLFGTFAGFGSAAAVLGKYRQTAGGRLRIMEWILRGGLAALAPRLSPGIASLLTPIDGTVEFDGKNRFLSPIGMLVSAIEEFKLRFPLMAERAEVHPFAGPIPGDAFGVVASNHGPRKLVAGFRKLWKGEWPADDERMVNTSAREVKIFGRSDIVNIDGDEHHSRSEQIRISCGPRVTVVI